MKAVKSMSIALLVAMGLFAGCASQQQSFYSPHSAAFVTAAEPITHPGLPNFYKVSDTLYRGAQPKKEGFRHLDRLGIKTVVDLRLFHSDEKDLEGTGIRYVSIPVNTFNPKLSQLREFLEVVTDPANQPVFLHCKRGADRTGTFVAAYRIIVEGWSTEQAIAEMTEGPFEFNPFWSGLPRFVKKLDVAALRAEFAPDSLTVADDAK